MSYLRIICFVFVAILLSSCSSESQDKDTIIVATSADNPPYEYIKDGKIIGLDIDIIEAIAKEMGKKIIIKNLDFPGLLPALSSNSLDLVIAGITATEERKRRVDFSLGYLNTVMAVLFKKSEKISSIKDFTGKVIGVQMGTTWESYAKELANNIPGIKIRSLANNLVLIEELKSGAIDLIIMEELQVNKFKVNVPDMESFVLDDTRGEFAIALPKDSSLTESINLVIKKMLDSGTIAQIKSKWL